ncbi:sensor histidine kinase [Cellulomonas triticagri]|uniref:sensor histidine kinase n=1 Tax=Cellulomonas triticagri TaxID=2483352 RepID=UPI0018F6CFBE|nr:histidine kinase [Cellulomonas triticagri]
MSAPPPVVAPPRLGPWSRTWRYLVAIGTGLVLWMFVTYDTVTYARPGHEGAISAMLVLDLVIGAAGTALLPLRRRYPVAVAGFVAALTVASSSAVGPATLALVSLSTRRRWREVLPVAGIWTAASFAYEYVYRDATLATPVQGPFYVTVVVALGIVVCGAVIAIGFYIGARRDLLASLRQRAEDAERAQEARAAQARDAERTRIAREMHDVLAHRISLVAMQAGGLAYRQDLTREQITESAEQIRDGAHRALGELREVLGVLRATGGGPGPVPTEREAPQPTLAELPALLADTVESGGHVHLDTSGLPTGGLLALADLPGTVSRTGFRILQEALTNARKHAPGHEVRVLLAGAPGDRLLLQTRNRLVAPGPAATPGSGLGLVGAAERAELVGGTLEHGPGPDGTYAVRVWLPWPT